MQYTTVDVKTYQNKYQRKFCMQPPHGAIDGPLGNEQRKTQYQRDDRARRHDAVIQFTLHDIKSLMTGEVRGLRVIDE